MKALHIALGITGGIAAYKTPELVRLLRQRGCEVTCILTRHGRWFVSPGVLQTLSGRPVIRRQFELRETTDIEHISLARAISLLLVAPATANILGKFAHGIADDFLSTFFMATDAPTLVCPAMNARMWQHAPVRENVARLRALGVEVMDPEEGDLACGEVGAGRLPALDRIVERTLDIAGRGDRARTLEGEKVLVTAGPTVEDLDPVRFLSNRSTGRMGFALAQEAARRGAQVVLVHGPTEVPPPPGVERVAVRSAADMRDAVLQHLPETTLVLMTAAVSDWRPERIAPQKEKKTPGPVTITLVRTPDILKEIAGMNPRPFLVGFAAETTGIEEYARAKLQEKSLDCIVANDVSGRAEGGFASDRNACLILDRAGGRLDVPLVSKTEMARRILDRVDEIRRSR